MGTFSNTWRHIRRSPYQAFAAISVMTLTFLVSGMFFLLSVGSTIVLKYFEQKPQIIIFFKDTKKEADVNELQDRLKLMDKVASVKFVSKEDALAIYKEQYKNDPLLLEMVSADILPASIEVSATKIEYLPDLANLLKKEADVSDIVFPEDVVNILVSWTTSIRQVGMLLVIFLSLVSLFTVVTVISMKIALKREEIEILQLVGAANWYIRMPFMAEGIIYGLVGSLIGWIVNVLILVYASPLLMPLFVGIPLFPIPLVFYAIFLAMMLALGTFLGILASVLAIDRYLRN